MLDWTTSSLEVRIQQFVSMAALRRMWLAEELTRPGCWSDVHIEETEAGVHAQIYQDYPGLYSLVQGTILEEVMHAVQEY